MNWLDKLEHFLIILVSRLAPWAAPLAPAYLVARSIQDHFEAPLWAGIAVGVTLEAVGVASAHITLEMHNYNTDPGRVQSDPVAPFWLGLVATGVYFISGIVLTVLLEVVPESVKIAPALFFVLAGVAYVTLALISGHSRRLEQVEKARRDRKRDRASIEPAQKSIELIECEKCGRSFGTMQALNAHGRWCNASTNGNEPAPEPETEQA